MKKADILKLVEKMKDDEDINELLKGTDIETSFKVEVQPTLDVFKAKLNSDRDFKSYMDSEKDTHANKALETWKTNNLQTLINDEVLKATGKKKTPEQLKIEEIEAKLQEETAKRQQAETAAKYKDILAQREIPTEMLEYFLAENDELTSKRIDNFKTYVDDLVGKGVKSKISDGSYTPPGENGGGELTVDDLAKMMG